MVEIKDFRPIFLKTELGTTFLQRLLVQAGKNPRKKASLACTPLIISHSPKAEAQGRVKLPAGK